ncbi:T-cell surface glycoprotein CD3 zeta chain [Xiphophorus hellerii]|uniref:T-cell surface glycoprotein CD3 zeta chain n=1 Tax=Xiphophorus hellerii TaxID=8084 RepID=UPI0013B4072E|nr:T-cell surface glycoprotein CD3 zeta chain [Xiphophorus hellerii]
MKRGKHLFLLTDRGMDSWMTGVFVLFALFMPVCCEETFFTDPVICYFLDAFLMVYCIAATALFFREKFSKMPRVQPEPGEKGGIYQELERPKDTDAYDMLDPKKAKGKSDRKKRAKKSQGKPKDKDPYESVPTSPRPSAAP